jgi:hypothetical protein
MTTNPVKPEKTILAKRPWHRLHLSTWLIILLVTGFFVIIEVPGETQGTMVAAGDGPSGSAIIEGESFLHGWPSIYLDRYEGISLTRTSSDQEKVPWLIPRAWKFYSNSKSRDFTLLSLFWDLLVVSTIIIAAAFSFEWRRRLRTRLVQFTLRELLLLTMLMAGLLSWWRIHHNQRIREQEIVNHFQNGMHWTDEYKGPRILAKVFGTKIFSDFGSFTDYCCFSTADNQKAEECFSCLKEFVDLEKITIENRVYEGEEQFASDETLLKFSTLNKLRFLCLPSAKITDSGIETISHFAKLTDLNLCETTITSRGIRCLESTPLLETLYLARTKIDDAAAETLGHLKYLMELDLSETKLTDRSVPHLGRLSNLGTLDISGTEITEKGYQELKAKLPDCSITYKN